MYICACKLILPSDNRANNTFDLQSTVFNKNTIETLQALYAQPLSSPRSPFTSTHLLSFQHPDKKQQR